jgi:hypothetical protein
MVWPPAAMMNDCCRIITRNSVLAEPYEDFRGPQQSKNMIFNVKKLLNDGMDLMLQRRSEK